MIGAFLLTVIVACTSTMVMAEPDAAELKIIDDCAAQFKLDKAMVMDMLKLKTPIDTNDKKCFIKCFGEALGIYNKDDGKLISEALKTKPPKCLDPAKIDEAIKSCEGLSGANPCDTSYTIGECVWKIAAKKE